MQAGFIIVKGVETTEIEKLTKIITSYSPQADLALVRRVYQYAARAHQNQTRLSGEPYIHHPLEVAKILADLQLDTITIAAALLHDVPEDTPVTLAELAQNFGEEIASLVEGVTKLGRFTYQSKEEAQVENLRKMFVAMAKDIRVILIKLADRLHNMQTLKYQPREKQEEIARETIEIFAPLAHRLGIFTLKWQLEDKAFCYLEPQRYQELAERISIKRKEREKYITQVIAILKEKLAEAEINADIQGRPKHLYSIYNKLVRKQKQLSEIYDLIAVRVIVETIKECYAALGIVHSLWKPIPGRFKDYVAMPKPNMYQSLHTTVIGPQGEPFEIQIRTWEMHRTAEYGIAAHWRYKEGTPLSSEEFEAKLSWLRQLLEWQREMGNAQEFIETVKADLFSHRVYVFTPRGDVIELPAGSVPLDFAYKIHTDVGHQCIGARVNGRIVPFDYTLKTGDIVEILTAKGGGPSRDWLKIVQTPQAKSRIRQWFKKEAREENIARGKELLEKEVRRLGLPLEYLKPEYLTEVAQRFNLAGAEDLVASVGDGAITSLQAVGKLKEAFLPEGPTRLTQRPRGQRGNGEKSPTVKIKGENGVGLMTRLAHCCNPLPGDSIIGYVTRGRGISVHRKDCPNILHHQEGERERMIALEWEQGTGATYQAQIAALAVDRPWLTADIMSVIADTKTIVNAVYARATKNSLATVDLKIEIKDLEQLHSVMEKVRRVKDVLEVKRVTPLGG